MKRLSVAAFAALLLISAAARAEIAKDTIKIGVLTDMSGLYSDLSGAGAVEAVKMAVADAGGTLNGKKIEVVSADHQNKPDIATAIARKWFDEDGVDMIVDLTTSSVALAVQEVARAKNKVILVSGAASSDLTGKACAPTSVHWTYDTVALANGTGSAVVKAGGDTWFFITADYAFGHALERDTATIVKENGGKVLGQVRAPLNTSDFSSYSAAGAGVRRQGHRARQCRRRHDQHDQAGGRIRHRPGRPEARRSVDLPDRRAQPRPQDRQRSAADLGLLLGPGRRRARLLEALLGQDAAVRRRWCRPAITAPRSTGSKPSRRPIRSMGRP